MANVGLPPIDWTPNAVGEFLTFVVPAGDGCNLKCKFCLIKKRKEITEISLPVESYADFIRDIYYYYRVAGVAIQGYEPLLPISLPHTKSILGVAAELEIPSSLVTNGTHLSSAMHLLREKRLNAIGISLDAAMPEKHDKLRGVEGAWAATVEAIPASIEQGAETGMQVSILSVLLPNRRIYLEGMPELLSKLGAKYWIISPLLTLDRDAWGSVDAKRLLLADLLALSHVARDHNITLTIDDELGLLQPILERADPEGAASLNIRRLPSGITLSRLSPGGECSIGADIARSLPRNAVRWDGYSDAAEFYFRIRQNSERMLANH